MPQSLSFVLVHVVWSVKGRRAVLGEGVRAEMHAYLAVTAREVSKGECFRVGGVADHVHLAVRMHPGVGVARVVQEVKRCSSKWMKMRGPEFAEFAWQRGYAAFSVGPADAGRVVPIHRRAGGAPSSAWVSGGDARVFREVSCGV